MAVLLLALGELEQIRRIAKGIAVSGMKRREGVLEDALILAREAFGDEFLDLGRVQVEHPGHQPERQDILALVLGCAANGFNGQARNLHTNVAVILFPFGIGRHMICVKQHNAAFAQGFDVSFVRVLVKRQQHIRFVTRTKNLASADAHLEN
jgi:hypothetical protein